MTSPPVDGSRDRRIEDISNLRVIHPAARALLRPAIRFGVSANAVSLGGFLIGFAAMAADTRLDAIGACLGLLLSTGWLIADGLDGMIARATGTSSAAGRVLDGVCDHGVFIVIYCGLAAAAGGGVAVWMLAIAAGAFHAAQSMIYEGERARFHRRLQRLPPPPRAALPFYDTIAGGFDRLGAGFETLLASPAIGPAIARAYAAGAAPPMRLMTLLSANVRVGAIFLAVLAGAPAWFWWFEIGPLTLAMIVAAGWHRLVERRILEMWDDRGPALGRNA